MNNQLNSDTTNQKFQNDALAPMHTTEHILNQTMVRMFGCNRSKNTHIEKKKSKCDYILTAEPTEEQVKEIEQRVNAVIQQNLPVSEEIVSYEDAAKIVDMSKLPDSVSDQLRLIRVGDYDVCACIGVHVSNTSEIGTFVITTHEYLDNRWRMRFKLLPR